MLYAARNRAKLEGVPCTLEAGYLESIWPVDNCCPVFGEEFKVNKKRVRGHAGPNALSPTLDKIRPELGYVPGNVVIISHRANTIKSRETDPAMLRRVADWLEKAL